MADFSEIPIPPERHPTPQAKASLSARLGFETVRYVQDWERYFADKTRLGLFIDLYLQGDLDEDEKFLLMDLILAAAAVSKTGDVSEQRWKLIETYLVKDFSIHHSSIWYWAKINSKKETPDNIILMSQRMQTVLLDVFSQKKTS